MAKKGTKTARASLIAETDAVHCQQVIPLDEYRVSFCSLKDKVNFSKAVVDEAMAIIAEEDELYPSAR